MLAAAKEHLEADPTARFIFVSKDPARVPSDLADRARSCDDNAKDFLVYCLSSAAHRRNYESLSARWGLTSTEQADAHVAIGLLSRMHFEHGFWEPSERHLLYRLAEAIAEGDGKQIVTFLGAHLEETLGNTHRSDDLRTVLRKAGHAPLDLVRDPRVLEGIERLQARFRSALDPYLIGSGVLSRPEPEQLVNRLCADGGARLIFVTGDAGSGKSGVLLDAVRLLGERAVPYLPIRLDTHYPDRAVRAYSRDRLELPASPGVCLRTLANGRRAVLIMDQLDAVRWTSANSDVGWELCKEIIDEALRSPNVSVVVAGRTVDLDEDPRIKHWKKGKEDGQAIEVEPFKVGSMPEDVVASFVGRYGVTYASLLPRERNLLRNAQNLQLWWRLAEDGSVGKFSSRAELLRSYWRHYRDKAVREYGVTIKDVNSLLDGLVAFLDAKGRLDAPNALLEGHGTAADALRKLGILDRTNGSTRFAHQSHLDYLTIERVFLRALRAEIAPIEWLRGHDQSLFRRDQVRFLLQLLRDQDSKLYLEFLQDIFFGEGVRFHIQHLALTTLAQAAPPTDGEYEFVMRLWNDPQWHLHVLERVLARREPWLDRFTDDGTIPGMLASDDEAQREEALFLCYKSADVAAKWFERVLAPHWDSGDPTWAERIGPRLAHDAEHDTSTVFQWRLARSRAGANEPEIHSAEQLAKKDPLRAISYLAAIADGLVVNVQKAAAGDKQRHVQVESGRFKSLMDACSPQPRRTWDALLPIHRSAVEVEASLSGPREVAEFHVHESARKIVSLVHDFLVAAGAALLVHEGAAFLLELRALGQAPASPSARLLAVGVLKTAPASLASAAVDCFLSVDRPLYIDAPPEVHDADGQVVPAGSGHCCAAVAGCRLFPGPVPAH